MPENTHTFYVEDHAVSGEKFELLFNPEYEWMETHPRPDKQNIQRYYESPDYISHTDARKTLFEKTYQFVKRINLKRKYKLLFEYHPNPGELLDVGCGAGDFLEFCQDKGWKISGLEPNRSARGAAESKTGIKIHEEAEWDELAKKSYDCITLWHVLEHLYNPVEELGRLSKMLIVDGTLIIAVPNYKCFDASFYKEHWAAYDVPRHLYHFSRQSMKKMAVENNLELVGSYPMLFDAYYVSLLSEKNKSGWTNLFRAFFIASRSNLMAGRTGEYSSLIYVFKRS